jgi:phage shock protein A
VTAELALTGAGVLLALLSALGGSVAWVIGQFRKRDRGLAELRTEAHAWADDTAAHARKGRDALAATLREEHRRSLEDYRREADRVFARETTVARLESRLDGIEQTLREVRDAVVPRASGR